MILQVNAPEQQDDDKVYFTRSGHAEFTSRVPLHTFTGESEYLTGMVDPGENIVDFYLDLNTLRTGVGRRDRDMFRTLNTSEHPFAEFTGTFTKGRDFDRENGNTHEVSVTGDFTIHGVTREVTIDGTIRKKENGNILLNAEWVINLNDYDIEPPGILFYRVNEEQEVEINVELEPQSRSEFLNNNS